MAGNDRHSGVSQLSKAIDRPGLRGEVIGEGREPLVIEGGAEVGDVCAEDEAFATM